MQVIKLKRKLVFGSRVLEISLILTLRWKISRLKHNFMLSWFCCILFLTSTGVQKELQYLTEFSLVVCPTLILPACFVDHTLLKEMATCISSNLCLGYQCLSQGPEIFPTGLIEYTF